MKIPNEVPFSYEEALPKTPGLPIAPQSSTRKIKTGTVNTPLGLWINSSRTGINASSSITV